MSELVGVALLLGVGLDPRGRRCRTSLLRSLASHPAFLFSFLSLCFSPPGNHERTEESWLWALPVAFS